MSIKQLQQQVDDWIKKYGVRYFDELTNMAKNESEPFEQNLHKI